MVHIIDGPNKDFAERLSNERNKTALTQYELAEAVGIDKRTISMYENGHMFPRGETLKRLAEKLNVDPVWLATGYNEANQNWLSNQYRNRKIKASHEKVELLFVEDWTSLQRNTAGIKRTYSENPRYGAESSNIEEFVPVIKTFLDQYRATRYPGMSPLNPSYPAGSILIFDAGPLSVDQIDSGSDVIFKFCGNENEPGLRRFTREPGLKEAHLVSLDPVVPASPILVDQTNIEIIGVVVSQIIFRRVM